VAAEAGLEVSSVSVEITMIGKICGLYGALLMLTCAGSGAAQGLPPEDEEVRVISPYTIRQQALPRTLPEMLVTKRISVETSVSYADLDLTKQADVDTMKDRLKKAARENCRELDRRFPRSVYIPVNDTSCIRDATYQSLARFDEIRGRYGLTARAR
jgi:UrcA family protein